MGYTIEEVAAEKKRELEEDYNFCKGKLAEIRMHESQIETIRKVYLKLIQEYRIKSVDRVLDYIRGKGITDSHELDILLCHCQNKLRGNIDGTEIDFCDKEVEQCDTQHTTAVKQ